MSGQFARDNRRAHRVEMGIKYRVIEEVHILSCFSDKRRRQIHEFDPVFMAKLRDQIGQIGWPPILKFDACCIRKSNMSVKNSFLARHVCQPNGNLPVPSQLGVFANKIIEMLQRPIFDLRSVWWSVTQHDRYVRAWGLKVCVKEILTFVETSMQLLNRCVNRFNERDLLFEAPVGPLAGLLPMHEIRVFTVKIRQIVALKKDDDRVSCTFRYTILFEVTQLCQWSCVTCPEVQDLPVKRPAPYCCEQF